jgi:acetate CoA/acetoacetate CoA-transferase alpha subunit
MKKAISVANAVEMIPDGAVLMIGGFMGVGSPHRIIQELVRQGKKNLTVIANDTGRPGWGIGQLIDAKLVRKLIVSHIGTNPETQRQMIAKEVEVELCPQGTLAERIHAGGYGLGGVVTPTGLGTVVAEGKQTVEVLGKLYLLETPLRADFALLLARRADYQGNLEYQLTARNFNPLMALAADKVIAEPLEVVPVGMIPPDVVITPHVLVDHFIGREKANG